ncbi:MAG: hypothetical protein ACLP7P_14385 [Rhodomicrobium sp.]
MTYRGKSAVAFIAIGLLIYAGLYFAAEQLMYRNGHSNPFFKIATATTKDFDWVILGASHAMPLDFSDFNNQMQNQTGLKIINLASPGTGPLYNRFVLEAFVKEHSVKKVLYVADSFAFYSRVWNEDRFSDSKMVRATPLTRNTAELLLRYCWRDGVDPRSLLDYLTGFSKINNRDRFQKDVWEGEPQFDRVYRSSASAIKSRISYLFPSSDREAAMARYIAQFGKLFDTASQQNVRVAVIKMPAPAAFRAALPNEKAFDEALRGTLAARGIDLKDFSGELDEQRFYFDTDHLNRAGVSELFARYLKALLMEP